MELQAQHSSEEWKLEWEIFNKKFNCYFLDS